MEGAPNPETVSTKLQKIAELARESPAMAFTSLNHCIDIDLLLEATSAPVKTVLRASTGKRRKSRGKALRQPR